MLPPSTTPTSSSSTSKALATTRPGRPREALLPFLQAHASSPNYTVSFGWKPGDFVLWDNLATWHYDVNDYDGPRAYRRVIGG
jgi:taurine dioxygenase